jgi:hypothetical protein
MRRIIILFIFIILIGGVVFFVRSKQSSSQDQPSVAETKTTVQPSTFTPAAPIVPDPFPHDKDRDGILDTKEKEMGTSDIDFDTDHDGLADADEVKIWKTDPKKADTDGDGYSDGLEVFGGFNPRGTGKL